MEIVITWFRQWKLASWRTAAVVVLVVYGLVGFFVVPAIAKKIIVDTARERTGREVTVEEVRCNPFALSLTIRGFSMPDRRPGTTLVSFDEFHANAQVSSLFRWAATLKELRVENPHLGLRRFADGGINVLELMDEIEARMPPAEKSKEEGGLPRALLQHILVTGTTMDIEDFARDEPLQMTLGPSKFELHDISTIPEKQGDNDFAIGLLQGGTIGVSGEVVVEPLGLDGTVTIDKIFLENAWPALKPYFQFDLVGGSASGHLDYKVELREDGLHTAISDLNYRLENLEVKVRDADTNLLEVPLVTISAAHAVWPEAEVGASSIVVEGAEAFLWLEPDGTPSWAELVPEETQEQVVKTYQQVEEAFPWQIDIDRFEIKDASAHFEDRTFDQTVQLKVGSAELALTDIITGPGHQWGLTASALLFGEANATAQGFVGTGPMRLETEVAVDDLDLGHFQPYIERIAPIELRAGRMALQGTAKVDPKGDGPMAGFAGDLSILEIDLRETVVGSRVLQWGRVDSQGIEASVEPMALRVDSIDINGAGIEVVVSEDGSVNLIEFMKVMAEQSQAEGGGTPTAVPPIEVDLLTLHSCSSAYTDRTLTPPFTLALDPVDGTIRGISSTATAGARLDIEGAVRSGGSLDLEGEIDILDPKRFTDLSIDVRQAVMPPVTPMSVRYIGHPIDEGVVDIGLEYEITNSELVGNNRFVTDGLALGDKVEGEGMVNLPVKLGVSLLTDKEGLITLEFPIEGNLDDPSFGLGNAIGSAAKEIVGELVKSPFRLLGKLGGGSGDEDFGHVEFEAGSAELETRAADKLRTLSAGAEQRPELILQVEGVYDAEADTAALQEAAFEALLAERQAAEPAESEISASFELLEALYRETVADSGLEALRAQHTTAAEGSEEGATETVLDETTYYRDLKATLVAAQPVNPVQLQQLGAARTESVRALLVDEAGIDPSRVQVLPPVAVEPTGGKWVRCRLDLAAGK
jgi:hypothetical protein